MTKAWVKQYRGSAEHEFQLGNFESAVATFDKALKLAPEDAEIRKERDEAARKLQTLQLKKLGEEQAREPA